LIRTRLDERTPIYKRKLGLAEVHRRIDDYYTPYHDAVSKAVEERYDKFGALWHLNLHSMPNDAYGRLGLRSDRPLADFVLGDRDGTTCEPRFVGLIEEVLRDKGYTVARRVAPAQPSDRDPPPRLHGRNHASPNASAAFSVPIDCVYEYVHKQTGR